MRIFKSRNVKLALASSAALFFTCSAMWMAYVYFFPQSGQGPTKLTLNPENQEFIVAERRALELQTRLNLTDSQVTEITGIIMELRSEVQRLREDNAGNIPAMIKARKTLISGVEEKIFPLLTPEQQQTFKEGKRNLEERVSRLEQFRNWFRQSTLK